MQMLVEHKIWIKNKKIVQHRKNSKNASIPQPTTKLL